MPRYQCTNTDCSKFQEQITIPKVRFIFNKQTEKMEPSEPIICPECGKDLQHIATDGMPTIHFNKFESLTPQEKKEVMHKRSVDHFKKTDKGDLDNYKKGITNKLRVKHGGLPI